MRHKIYPFFLRFQLKDEKSMTKTKILAAIKTYCISGLFEEKQTRIKCYTKSSLKHIVREIFKIKIQFF
jgi:hypothetical protein